MAGDRDDHGTVRDDRGLTQPDVAAGAGAPGRDPDGAAITAVAGALSGGPAQVAAVLRHFPGQQDAMLHWLQAHRGNAYVQAVLAERVPERSTSWSVVVAPHSVRFVDTEVGAVSPPRTVRVINHGTAPVEIASIEPVLHWR